MNRIAAIEVIPIIGPVPAPDDLDGTTNTVIVRLTDEAGLTGIGETDAPPRVVKAFLEMQSEHLWSRGVSEILIGADPLEATGLWQKLYEGTFWPGRRGLGIHAYRCHAPHACTQRIQGSLAHGHQARSGSQSHPRCYP